MVGKIAHTAAVTGNVTAGDLAHPARICVVDRHAGVIEIARRSGAQLWVAKGLHPGEKVALKDPSPQEQL